MRKCKLVINDEINVKFEGLDVSTRRKLVNLFKYKLPYAYHIPAVRLGRWDGCLHYFNLGGSTYLNLVEEILPILERDGYDIDLEDHRSSESFTFTKIDENYFSHINWPDDHSTLPGQPIIMRDYQVETVNNFQADPQCVQILSTAGGKTLITAACSRLCEPYGRTIVIVPSKKLVEQTTESYELVKLDVGMLYGKRKEYDKTHTICTWQTIMNLNKKTKKNEAPIPISEFTKDVVAVIIDECHGAAAEQLKKILTDIFPNVGIRWGLTGTIPKEKHFAQSIHCCIGPVVGTVTAAELQEEGYIAHCNVNIIQTKDDISYNNYQQELTYLLTNEKRMKYLAKLIKKISLTGNTLVMVDRKVAGYTFEELIKDSVFVHGSTKDKDRDTQYDEFKTSENKIIIATYGVASTGIDLPRIFNMIMIEPGKSFVRVIQSIGRGLRLAEDKDEVTIWDICSNSKYSKRHLPKRKSFYKEQEYPFTVEKVDII